MDYMIDPRAVQESVDKSQGGIAGIGALVKWTAGTFRVRLGPPYKEGMGLPWVECRVHWNVYEGRSQPPACLWDVRKEPCPVCQWVRAHRDDPVWGALAKKRQGKTRAFAQILIDGQWQKGWQPWAMGWEAIQALLPYLTTFPDLCHPERGRFLRLTFAQKAQWLNLTSVIPEDPSPVPREYYQYLKNLDPAIHMVDAAELERMLSMSRPVVDAGAPGGYPQQQGYPPVQFGVPGVPQGPPQGFAPQPPPQGFQGPPQGPLQGFAPQPPPQGPQGFQGPPPGFAPQPPPQGPPPGFAPQPPPQGPQGFQGPPQGPPPGFAPQPPPQGPSAQATLPSEVAADIEETLKRMGAA